MRIEVPVVEKEFCRKGLSHRNYVCWSLVFNSTTGELAVKELRTSVAGPKLSMQSVEGYLKTATSHQGKFALKSLLSKIERLLMAS